MLILTGSNLGERHRELNTKVKEAVTINLDFDQAKDAPENSDVDKLFKIDLASKYKNIEYIIETLKAGDSLHISRALKCLWMYEDEYANIISVDNLHNNVIPFLSTKMKKKLLTTISSYVRNEDRAATFYKYCMDNKLKSIALKFLNFTSIDFKLELLQDAANNRHLIPARDENLKHFIRLSFTLAEAYIALFDETTTLAVFCYLSYLFSVSEENYLNMLEKYVVIGRYNNAHLGVRISRSIMKKHKSRVLRKPSLYVKILNNNVLIRHSIAEDAKIYLPALLPDDVYSFWRLYYCDTYKDIISLLNVDERFEYVKKIFITKYPNEEFEMCLDFYRNNAYKMMTDKEKETWALRQIAREDEILGIGKDYIWYKFISFEKAFVEMKKLIMITPDNAKRLDMVNVLVESAKNQRHVETLLKHYYARHINEPNHAKGNFLDNIIQHFNVYEFDEDCWTALNALFYSVDVYSMTNVSNFKSEYKLIPLIYSIINKTEVHDAILLYINTSMRVYALKLNTDKLPKEQQEMVFQYLFDFYMDEIKKYENVPYGDNVRDHLRKYIYFVLDLLKQYNKTKEDRPEVLIKFMKLEWPRFEFHSFHCATHVTPEPTDLLYYLKQDANLLLGYLPTLKHSIETRYFYITPALKKLKIYFSNDIAKEFLKIFETLLSQDPLKSKAANAAAHGVFILADDSYKIDFMTKYALTESKINHSEINENLLRIQEAICAHACYSRPPVPLKYVMDYIKGDYVQFCLPMIYSYLANLPLPHCMEFVEALLDKPVSIQKHGIRLLFKCFSAENVNKVVAQVWKKTKNVSLRLVIFKAIYDKVYEEERTESALYFKTLKIITLTLNCDDDDEIFYLLVSYRLPFHFLSEYIKVAWTVVSQLPLKAASLNRMRAVIERMNDAFNSVCQSMVGDIVDQFITSVFDSENEGDKYTLKAEKGALKQSKWNLIAKYVTYVPSKDVLDSKLGLLTFILNKFLEKMRVPQDKYVWKGLLFDFLHNLEGKSYCHSFITYTNVNILMESGLHKLQEKMAIEEIYGLLWQLRLGVIARQVIADAEVNKEKTQSFSMNEIALKFAKGLGNLIKEFVEKEMYYASLSEDIKKKVVSKLHYIKNEFDVTYVEDEMLIVVSFGLMQFDLTEIYLLVLNLIPSNPKFHPNEYFKSIMQKLTKLKNIEIQCNLYRKFGKFMNFI